MYYIRMKIKPYLFHILLPILAAVIINIIIYTQGWSSQSPQSKPSDKATGLLPPGYAIAIIWIFILGLLGLVHYLTYPSFVSGYVALVIIYCLAYPFLTNGLREENAATYNILAFITAVFLSIIVFMQNKKATIYTLPYLIWTSYVASVTFIKLNSYALL